MRIFQKGFCMNNVVRKAFLLTVMISAVGGVIASENPEESTSDKVVKTCVFVGSKAVKGTVIVAKGAWSVGCWTTDKLKTVIGTVAGMGMFLQGVALANPFHESSSEGYTIGMAKELLVAIGRDGCCTPRRTKTQSPFEVLPAYEVNMIRSVGLASAMLGTWILYTTWKEETQSKKKAAKETESDQKA
jgi:hypothetical protein